MAIEFDLAAHLASRPQVSAIVGARLYAESAEQEALRPLLTYRLLPGSTRHYHSQGASGLVEADIELSLQGTKYKEARQLYDAVRDEIDGFQGQWGTTEVRRAILSPPASGTFPPVHGDEVGFPSVRAVVEVFYRESIPALGAS
mgnify:FL=1